MDLDIKIYLRLIKGIQTNSIDNSHFFLLIFLFIKQLNINQ